jgi:protein-S-isoprenylcysteine O-methyltransferase Ste14
VKPAFAADPAVSALFAATIVVWLALELRQALRRRPGATNRDQGSLNFVRICAVAGALLAATAIHVNATSYPESPPVIGLSLVLMWAGVALRWWCFHTLGRFFTFTVMTSPDQHVISSGPYKQLRHPSYLGILLVLTGIGLSYGNWLSLAALVLTTLAGFVYRIHVEEAALASALGPAYVNFAAGRKRLVPFVW